MRKHSQGFTLIEVMIVVAIVAILAAIALPSYNAYVQRGKITTGINQLSSYQAQMEQYYQDNRTYLASSAAATTPACSSSLNLTDWTISCGNWSASTYTVYATGKNATNGLIYTVDQSGNQNTSTVPSNWGALPTSHACYITKKGMTC